jgi:hypothetical protein
MSQEFRPDATIAYENLRTTSSPGIGPRLVSRFLDTGLGPKPCGVPRRKCERDAEAEPSLVNAKAKVRAGMTTTHTLVADEVTLP